MIEVFGVNKYIRKTQKQKELLKQRPAEYVRRLTKRILTELVLLTPQWTGNTAASWKVVTSSVSPNTGHSRLYREDWQNVNSKFMGDREALQIALAENAEALNSIRYNSKIKIINVAPFADELATDPHIEKQLRTGNFIPGDVMAVKTVTAKYRVFSNIVGAELAREFTK